MDIFKKLEKAELSDSPHGDTPTARIFQGYSYFYKSAQQP